MSWIALEAEFTLKLIQTTEDHARLVYVVKIEVKNDGRLKIEMLAELWLEN